VASKLAGLNRTKSLQPDKDSLDGSGCDLRRLLCPCRRQLPGSNLPLARR